MPRLFVGSFLDGPEAIRLSSLAKAREEQLSSALASNSESTQQLI